MDMGLCCHADVEARATASEILKENSLVPKFLSKYFSLDLSFYGVVITSRCDECIVYTYRVQKLIIEKTDPPASAGNPVRAGDYGDRCCDQ